WEKQGESVAACIPSELAGQLGLKEKILGSLPVQHECVDFTEYSDITFTLDMANQRLDISIPQSLLAWKSESWMPPSTWDHGVNGLLFDYNLFASTY
ncbi:MAG: FimD/PapC N-terminal domain-containing protein, partial [Hafnia sp.]